MTTATNDMFAQRDTRSTNAPSALLSIVSLLLGVQARESLAAAGNAQTDAGYAWGL